MWQFGRRRDPNRPARLGGIDRFRWPSMCGTLRQSRGRDSLAMGIATTQASRITKADSMSDLNELNQASPVPASVAVALRAGLVSRRRFARAGAAVPVVLTMVSLPVHAAPICINPSGFISQNTYASRHPGGVPPPCATVGPTAWAAAADSVWPGGKPTKDLKFKDVFGGTSRTKLIDVVKTGSNFDKYCVAAFLNASKGNVPNFPLTVSQSKGLWTAIKGGAAPMGSTKPSIPVTSPAWGESMAVSWLKTVMP